MNWVTMRVGSALMSLGYAMYWWAKNRTKRANGTED